MWNETSNNYTNNTTLEKIQTFPSNNNKILENTEDKNSTLPGGKGSERWHSIMP